ncbi:MAG: asparagine synthetase B [Candidatus Methanolliviera sp. GoM_asphalt]|nr:MAG: asparagine synthetase B [Candidatus Methanolliviera sp. GoM_asphalt]
MEEVVEGDPAEGLLLSGGLDTSVIASIASKKRKNLKAFTVTLKGYDEDLKYAKKVTEFLDLDHIIYYFSEEEMIKAVPCVMRITKCRYFEIKSIVPVFIAMKVAKDYVGSLYVGDGADELFAGYSPMVTLIDLLTDERYGFSINLRNNFEDYFYKTLFEDSGEYLRSPHKIGEVMGIDVKVPYLDRRIREYARKIPMEYKVREEKGKRWGKWILRKAFEGFLPEEIIWREKVPIDIGAGSMKLKLDKILNK